MTKRVCMGNEAIALGAAKAGVSVVSGYPGTPSTEIIETLLSEKIPGIEVQWSTNEKTAMEVAAGAAYAGARSMVTMKQVGLNVAADPLMSLSYVGVEGGMVVVVADDPGPWSSQTEQDTRHFAKFANLPVFDPSSPEEAYQMVSSAFDLSEEFKLPVFLRPTTRVCHASATVDLENDPGPRPAAGFEKKPDWIIFPALSYRKHGELEQKQKLISDKFSTLPFNRIIKGGKKGIAVSGISYLYAMEVIKEFDLDLTVFKVGTPYPLPLSLAEEFLSSVDQVMVVEELDPVLEEQLLLVSAGKNEIFGKMTGGMPCNGEYSFESIKNTLLKFAGAEIADPAMVEIPKLPVRPPVLCAGCPHRASFYAAKTAAKNYEKTVYCGDIGCYTLGNAAPLNTVDTCLCMGAGITIAQGIKLAEKGTKCIAFIGDSTFFHTGIPGIINAVYQNTDITIAVLDNHTTAMTGGQPHPGTGRTAMGMPAKPLDIEKMLMACGVEHISTVDPFKYEETVDAFKNALEYNGPSAVIAKAPCIALIKLPVTVRRVNEACIGCLKCIKQLGCPAMSVGKDGKVLINESICTDCSLCVTVCPVGAIKRVDRNV
ncbi:MAG: indolepyruvate ferredoxin oxidoreductase subunit alpha [Synergistota bacterium]|nr:indolepyruvate ferredoxin oxidoreductase subunit alpha [Synergistota bacterium]